MQLQLLPGCTDIQLKTSTVPVGPGERALQLGSRAECYAGSSSEAGAVAGAADAKQGAAAGTVRPPSLVS